MKILIVEDEERLLENIVQFLNKDHFQCETASTVFSAEDKLISFQYDAVILDINLPDGNGLDILALIKKLAPETGVLILSARDSLDDKLKGLDLGADDYLTKPFHLAELNSRIHALIRRNKFQGSKTIRFNELVLNADVEQKL